MKYKVDDGFPYYIELVADKDYRELFLSDKNKRLLSGLTEEKATYRYAIEKWSIKQIIGHITDHERIMMYRALRFSRKADTLLAGYDQNLFVENSRFDEQSLSQLMNDFGNVRNATLSFIESLSPEQLALTGTAWKYKLTVEEFLKATIGHELHHMEVMRNKYLI